LFEKIAAGVLIRLKVCIRFNRKLAKIQYNSVQIKMTQERKEGKKIMRMRE
jgi:hypothetical protein